MDDDSCGKFIGSLTKYLQSLCHSYVEFKNGVELAGHIYLNVDTGTKIDYVLNESVCKNGANVVKFTSNSYHAQPVEKKDKKDTPKKDPPRKNDDDDVIIVGSEGSKRNRTPGSSPSRSHASPNQMQRGIGMNRMGQGGMFRSPRGLSPRFGSPITRPSGYTYQPRQRLTYPQQPRNYMPGYSPRMRQPYQPRGAQQMPLRGNTPVDTDVAFMREEYVQPGQAPYRQPQQTQQPLQMQQQQPGQVQQPATGQVYGAPFTQAPGQPSMAAPQTVPSTMSVAMTAGQPANTISTVAPGQDGSVVGTVPGTTEPNIFQPTQPATAPVSGGMPLPVTTHTIFDSGPVMSSDLPTPQLQVGEVGSMPVVSDPLSSSVSAEASVPVSSTQNLLIGQVWSELTPASDSSTAQPTSAQSDTQGAVSAGDTSLASLQSTDPASSTGQSGQGYEVFNQQTTSASQPPSAAPFSPTHNSMHQSNTSSTEGDRFSALVSELQAFNQQPGSRTPPSSQPPSGTPLSSPTTTTAGPGNAAESSAQSSGGPHGTSHSVRQTIEPIKIKREPGLKRDPDAVPNTTQPTPHESTEAASKPIPETFLTPSGGNTSHGGSEGHRMRSGSTSSHSHGTPSPSPGNLVGPESVVIETKPFLHHPPDYDSETSTPSGDTHASAQAKSLPASHSNLPSLPNTQTPTSAPITVKKERITEDEVPPEPVKRPQSEWQNKAPESDWVTDMSALNNSDDSMESDSDTAQDDDDPNYTPGRPLQGVDKGPKRKKLTRKSNALPVTEIKKEVVDPGYQDRPVIDSALQNTVIDILDSDENEDQEEEAASESFRVESRDDDDEKTEEEDESSDPSIASRKGKTGGTGVQRKMWTEEEKSTVETHFWKFIEQQKLPGKLDIETVIRRESVLQGRSWQNVKDFLRNSYLASAKRARGKQTDKGIRGKRRKLDNSESDGGGDEQPPSTSEAFDDDDSDLPFPELPGSLDSDHLPEEEQDSVEYKPGAFILINVNKDSHDRPSRTRNSPTPAEVIVTPEGQEEGVWVHVLVPAANGLWRLPNPDQLEDLRVDPADIIKTLENTQVKIMGSKVLYKFEDM